MLTRRTFTAALAALLVPWRKARAESTREYDRLRWASDGIGGWTQTHADIAMVPRPLVAYMTEFDGSDVISYYASYRDSPYTGPFKATGYTETGAWAEEIIHTKNQPRKLVTQAIGYARWDGQQWVSGD